MNNFFGYFIITILFPLCAHAGFRGENALKQEADRDLAERRRHVMRAYGNRGRMLAQRWQQDEKRQQLQTRQQTDDIILNRLGIKVKTVPNSPCSPATERLGQAQPYCMRHLKNHPWEIRQFEQALQVTIQENEELLRKSKQWRNAALRRFRTTKPPHSI